MEKELLQKAIDSILHGSTQIVSSVDSYGNHQSQEIRINDLRVPLIEKLAEKLATTDEFKKALANVFTNEVAKKIQDAILANVRYGDLPYDVRNRLEKEMKETKLEIRSYKLVAEVVNQTDL